MRRIAIVGAGQAGLQLGIGLLKQDYHITFINDKTEDEIAQGFATSSQGMFNTALSYETQLGLNFWDQECPNNETVSFSIIDPITSETNIFWQGHVQGDFRAVDQRLKFPRWIQEAKKLGAKFIYEKANVELLEALAEKNDLVIVASGKGNIGSIFEVNYTYSRYTAPQRTLSLIYVKNVKPLEHGGVRAHIIPNVGEYFIMPALGINGICETMLFEGHFGSPFDCWNDTHTPEAQLEQAMKLLKQYIPFEAERCANASLSDPKGVLKGAYTPYVKNPVAKLPSGKKVLGMADAVLLNDPIAGQGSNNASKCAMVYLEAILKQQDKPFDEPFMQKTFDLYWNDAGSWATYWTNLLLEPPKDHVISLLQSATENKNIANYLANAFDSPKTLFPWILQPTLTKRFINENSSLLQEIKHAK